MTHFTNAFRRFFLRWMGDGQVQIVSRGEGAVVEPQILSIGRVLFALGLAGLGVLSLIYRSFALVWQPMPESFPHRELLGIISGSILLGSGTCMLLPRSERWATLVMAVFISSWPALQIVFNLWEKPLSAQMWTTLAETVMLISGGYILFRSKMQDGSETKSDARSVTYVTRTFQLAFAVALPVISISHFAYAFSKPARTPPWIPFYVGVTFLTGLAHTAAGIGIVSRIASRLAANLEAIMIGLFALILHVPLIFLQPTNRLYWTALFIATSCIGASFIVASSIPKAPVGVRS
jgi:uncharacterized membrane protein